MIDSWSMEDFYGSDTTFYDTMMVDMGQLIHWFKPIESTRPGVNPHVNYGFWVIIMRQCRFIDYIICTTLVWDVGNGGGMCGSRGGGMGI